MSQFAGACRFVYNKALAFQKESHAAGETFVGKFALKKLFTEWRNSADTPWLAEAPRHPCDEAILDLDRAFQNFFAKRSDFPRFKRKGERDGFRYPDQKRHRLADSRPKTLPDACAHAVGESKSATCRVATGAAHTTKWRIDAALRAHTAMLERSAAPVLGRGPRGFDQASAWHILSRAGIHAQASGQHD